MLIVIAIGLIVATAYGNSNSATAQSNQKTEQRQQHPKAHEIQMGVEELSNDRIVYKINNYVLRDLVDNSTTDITSNYDNHILIPGPTIVANEGDKIQITLINEMGWGYPSVHTHGAHYRITSDGTLKELNKVSDQAASPSQPYTFEWDAGNGTAGSWPFHDHTMGRNVIGKSMDGLETEGLFSSIIINPADAKVDALIDGIPTKVNVNDIDKDFILFVNDDVFWGSEIDYTNNGKHAQLDINPTLTATNNSIVRFNIQSIGNEFHNFEMDNIRWLKPGTNTIINSHVIGPLANHVFTIKADSNATYFDNSKINLLAGMKGSFVVADNNGKSSLNQQRDADVI